MNILAIDPGPVRSAWLIWDGERICGFGIDENDKILSVCDNTGDGDPADILAIEKIASYGMPVGAEVFETCLWSGRFLEAWLRSGHTLASVTRIPRLQVKLHHCHSTKANDSTIRQALIDRLGPPGTKKAPGLTYGITKDAWAALALAVQVHDTFIVQEAA